MTGERLAQTVFRLEIGHHEGIVLILVRHLEVLEERAGIGVVVAESPPVAESF